MFVKKNDFLSMKPLVLHPVWSFRQLALLSSFAALMILPSALYAQSQGPMPPAQGSAAAPAAAAPQMVGPELPAALAPPSTSSTEDSSPPAVPVIAAVPPADSNVRESANLTMADILNADPSDERVAAVVNDDVITTSDVRARLALSLLTSSLPPTQENEERMLPQVLRGLIDEQLQLQEAKRDGISPEPAEEKKVLDKISQENGVPPDQLSAFLGAHNIPLSTLQHQVHAYLSWSKVVQTKLRPAVDVGDQEIQSRLDEMKANEGKPEYLLAEIYLAVDNPRDEPQIEALADRLAKEIRGGANFAAAAQQFSQGLGNQQGGDIGWIQQGQLAPEIDKVLPTLHRGQLTDPIRTGDGFHILLLRDERKMSMNDPSDTHFKLVQLALPFAVLPGPPPTAPAPAADTGPVNSIMRVRPPPPGILMAARPSAPPPVQNGPPPQIAEGRAIAEKLRADLKDCATAEAIAKAENLNWQYRMLDNIRMGDEPLPLQQALADMKPGSVTPPLLSDKGVGLIMVCERHDPTAATMKETLADTIGTEKLDMQARRLLRDLRRSAFIDIRLK